jgi:hypothetical protein
LRADRHRQLAGHPGDAEPRVVDPDAEGPASTSFGAGNPQLDIPQLLSMYKVGMLNLDDMITRQYTLEQINGGYQDTLDGKNIRGIVRYTGADR